MSNEQFKGKDLVR